MKWIKVSAIVCGISVGVGVITCVFRVLYRSTEQELLPKAKKTRKILKVPKHAVGLVMGKHGETLNRIRERTQTMIVLENADENFAVATITGEFEEVEEAVSCLTKIITKTPSLITKDILIPDKFSDYFIGKNGNNIRQICHESGTKIVIDWTPDQTSKSCVKITIEGREEEVNAAIESVDKLIAEAEVSTNNFVHVAGRALPEKLPLNLNNNVTKDLPCEKLIPNSADGYLEIYVSAVENPSRFWVQICGSNAIQLDKLATEMSDFYNDDKNKSKFHLDSPNIGDIVAAYYESDNSWYRAKVLKVSESSEKGKQIDIFYLDFGDQATLGSNLICRLKHQYLSIPFQAIECSLACVKSKNTWSAEAIEEFSKMVYLAQWKPIMAKPLDKSPKNQNDSTQYVHLYDTNTDCDKNISEELIKLNFAVLD